MESLIFLFEVNLSSRDWWGLPPPPSCNALWQICNWRKIELCNTGVENQGHACSFWGGWGAASDKADRGVPAECYGVRRQKTEPVQQLEVCRKERLSETFQPVSVRNVWNWTSDPVGLTVSSGFAWALNGPESPDVGETAKHLQE